jgi:hypothetical protein
MTNNRLAWLSDQLCILLFPSETIHGDNVDRDILQCARANGFLVERGNGWYALSEYGRDNAAELIFEEEQFEGGE